jgi:hypothetical protein
VGTSDDGAGGQQPPARDDQEVGRVKRRVGPVLTLLSLAFVGWAGWDIARRWESAQVGLQWLPALLGLLLLPLGSLIQGYCWIKLIDRMSGRRVPRAAALSLYLESQLARYAPGKVGLPLVRMAGASRLGVAASTVGSSVLVEMLSWVAVGGTLGFLLLSLTSGHVPGVLGLLGRVGPLLLAASAAAVLLLLAVDRRRLPAALLRVLKLGGEGPLVPPAVPLIHAVYWCTWAGHGYLLGCALGAESATSLAAAGLFVLAPIAGFIVLMAPAGIGVREAVLSLGLVPGLGAAPALAAALISRAASLCADLGTWAVVRALGWGRPAQPAA